MDPRLLRVLRILRILAPRGVPDGVRMVLCAGVGGLAAWIGVPGGPRLTRSAPAPALEITLAGKRLPLDGDPAATLAAADRITADYLAGDVAILADGERIVRRRSSLGASVDRARLRLLVRQLTDPGSAMRRAAAQQPGRPLRAPLPVALDDGTAFGAVLAIKDDLDRSAVDARLDLLRRTVVPEAPGRRVDVYATLTRLEDALARGSPELDAVVETPPATRTAASIGDVAIDEVLGFFETKYTPDRKHADRTFNLRLAASKLDGHVVMPGETFDFNEVVGPRSEANGYRVAPVIAQGELVDGIGGGTCQVAGTLHGAAFFAGLDIVERKPHTRPSFYIKMGMDATVVYPTITLKLKNPFDFPIVLHETVADGVVRAEILGKKRTRDVTFVRRIDEVVPFVEREAPDPKVPVGSRVLAQRGIPGFKVTRYRIVRDGASAVREHDTDLYPPTAQIWHVGTGEDATKEPPPDEHPEYVADEYLAIAQGPHVVDPHAHPDHDEDSPGGPMVETRIAGRYGTHGWTVREGFAKRLE